VWDDETTGFRSLVQGSQQNSEGKFSFFQKVTNWTFQVDFLTHSSAPIKRGKMIGFSSLWASLFVLLSLWSTRSETVSSLRPVPRQSHIQITRILNQTDIYLHPSDYAIPKPTPTIKKPITNDVTVDDQQTYQQNLRTAGFWFASTVLCGGILALWKGQSSAFEFASGYLLEQCLSIDNLFVFLLLFKYFDISKTSQERILSYGLLGAATMRALFILTGYLLLQKFSKVMVLFSIPLMISSYKILTDKHQDDDDVSSA
jgi:hypothetical protein